MGRAAGNQNAAGQGNTFTGYESGFGNQTGNSNSCYGVTACLHNSTGIGNVALGAGAGFRNETGSRNTFVGTDSAFGILSQSNGNNNTFTGWEAGFTNKTGGDNNVFYGYQAGVANTTGRNNVFYGYQAGSTNIAGSNNVYLAHFGVAGDNNTIRLGMNGPQNRAFFEPILSNISTFLSPNIPVLTIATSGANAGQLGYQLISTGGNVNGNCPPGPGGFFITQWLGLNTIGCSPIFHKTSNDFIGIGTTTPSTELDVNGDINAKYDRTSYQINESTVLQAFGSGNLFVGFGTGTAGPNSGTANTFVGGAAGQHNTTGHDNAFFGNNAGLSNVGGTSNGGSLNTFVGTDAGFFNVSGSENTFVGWNAGGEYVNSSNNTYVGYQAGVVMKDPGGNNTCVGAYCGNNFANPITGGNNIYVGYNAGSGNGGTNNNNLYIGNVGAAENSTTRIGTSQTNAFMAGIWNVAINPGKLVCIDASGHLGTTCTLAPQAQGSPQQEQVIAQQQQQIESLQKQNAEFQQRLARLESLIAQK